MTAFPCGSGLACDDVMLPTQFSEKYTKLKEPTDFSYLREPIHSNRN